MQRFLGILFILLALQACVNDLESIKKVSHKSTDPDERTKNLHLIYKDAGYAQVEVHATLAETYSKPQPVIKLKDGIEVKFFDQKGKVVSILTALYGEIHPREAIMFVKDSVQLFNKEKNQRLETEELRWNQRDSLIYSDNLVSIRTPEALFFGKGVKTKQDFTHYEFIQPRGKIRIKK